MSRDGDGGSGGSGGDSGGGIGCMSNSMTFEFSEPPVHWEYVTHVIPHAMMQQALDELGRDGWELSQAFPCAVQVDERPTVPSKIIAPPGAMSGESGTPMHPPRESGLMMIFKRPKRVLRDDVGRLRDDVGVN